MPTINSVTFFISGSVQVTDSEGYSVLDLEDLSPNNQNRFGAVRDAQQTALSKLFARVSLETKFSIRDHVNLAIEITPEEFCSVLGFRKWYWERFREPVWVPASGGHPDQG